MDTTDKFAAFFAIGFITLLGLLIAGIFIFNAIEAKQKDRELSIREREIELKAEQYPYKTEAKLEVTHD
jgi:hypothetical protein